MDLFTFGFAICLLSGLGCFGLFFKCIDWFDSRTFAGLPQGGSPDGGADHSAGRASLHHHDDPSEDALRSTITTRPSEGALENFQ